MEKGDLVLVDYVGKADGEIFDLSVEEKAKEEGMYNENTEYRPIPILVGYDYVIDGFEENVKEMEVGEEREFTVSPEKGYGKRDSEQVETYPEKEFNRQDVDVQVGDQLMIGRRRGRVISKGSGRVRIDFNHPLAGKELDYWVRVNEKVEDDEEKARKIFDFRIGHGDIRLEDDKVVIEHKHEGEHAHQIPEQVKEAISDEITDNTGFEEVEFDED